MLRPDEVSDTPDEERARMFALCERAIDEQLRTNGLRDGAATVHLPEGCERLIADLCRFYGTAGWEAHHVGSNLLEFRRGAYCKGSWALGNNCRTCWRCLATDPQRKAPSLTNQQRIDHALASGAKSLDLVVQPGEVLTLPKGSTWQED